MTDFSFLCTFVPGSEKSTDGTFVPVELSFPGTFALVTFTHVELSFLRNQDRTIPELFLPGTFVPSERILQELSLQLSKNDLKL